MLIDAHVEEDWLHPQQHATLDLSGQGVKQWSWQRDPYIKAITSGERESRGEVRTLRVGDRPKAYFRALGDTLATVAQVPTQTLKEKL